MTSTESKTAPAPTPRSEVKNEVAANVGQPTGYSPEADSTPTLKAEARKTGRVVLDLSKQRCLCGCTGECAGRFQPGHDAKLRGKLNRAAIAGVGLLIVIDGQRRETTPRRFAALLTTPKHDWVKALDEAVAAGKKAAEDAKVRKAEAAKKAAERKAAAGKEGRGKLSLEDFAK